MPLIRLGRTGLHAAAQRRTPLVLAPLKNLHRIAWLPIQSQPGGAAARGGRRRAAARRTLSRSSSISIASRRAAHDGARDCSAQELAAQRDGRRGGCGSLSSDSRPWIEISLITTCALSVGPSLSHPPPPPRRLSVKGPRQAHTRARAHARPHAAKHARASRATRCMHLEGIVDPDDAAVEWIRAEFEQAEDQQRSPQVLQVRRQVQR